MKLMKFDVSADDPRTNLNRRHGSICLGWVPWQVLEAWDVLAKLPEDLKHETAVDSMASAISMDISSFTSDWTPFHGCQIEEKPLEALSHIYDRFSVEGIKYHIWGHLILLRNIFFSRFGEDACKWWEHIQSIMSSMRGKGLPADEIFLLVAVAFCEVDRRRHVTKRYQSHERGLNKIIRGLGRLVKDDDVRHWSFSHPLCELIRIREQQKSNLERWKSLKRFAEPESLSPLLQLVNIRVVELLLESKLGVNQACKEAAKIYLGFDLFGAKTRKFRFDCLNGDNRESKTETEAAVRSKRVKRSYYNWKDRQSELEERIEFDYRGFNKIIV